MKIQSILLIFVLLLSFSKSFAAGPRCIAIFTKNPIPFSTSKNIKIEPVQPTAIVQSLMNHDTLLRTILRDSKRLESSKTVTELNQNMYLMVRTANRIMEFVADHFIMIRTGQLNPQTAQTYMQANLHMLETLGQLMGLPTQVLGNGMSQLIIAREARTIKEFEAAQQRTTIGFTGKQQLLTELQVENMFNEFRHKIKEILTEPAERGPLGFTAKTPTEIEAAPGEKRPIGFGDRKMEDIPPAAEKVPIGFVRFPHHKDPNSFEPDMSIAFNPSTGIFDVVRIPEK